MCAPLLNNVRACSKKSMGNRRLAASPPHTHARRGARTLTHSSHSNQKINKLCFIQFVSARTSSICYLFSNSAFAMHKLGYVSCLLYTYIVHILFGPNCLCIIDDVVAGIVYGFMWIYGCTSHVSEKMNVYEMGWNEGIDMVWVSEWGKRKSSWTNENLTSNWFWLYLISTQNICAMLLPSYSLPHPQPLPSTVGKRPRWQHYNVRNELIMNNIQTAITIAALLLIINMFIFLVQSFSSKIVIHVCTLCTRMLLIAYTGMWHTRVGHLYLVATAHEWIRRKFYLDA